MDFDRSIVLVAEVDEGSAKAIVGAGRISREEMSDDFTFSLQVLPECRKKGAVDDWIFLGGLKKCFLHIFSIDISNE